jgi:hypothetical protein
MSLSIESWAEPVRPEDISTLEARLNVALPSDYREFLLRQNGGRVLRGGVFRALSDGEKVSRVNVLLSVSDIDYKSIEHTTGELDGRIPVGAVAIAYDGGGNPLLMSCCAADFGRIYFADLEFLSAHEPSSTDELRPVAKDFTSLLQLLNEH